MRLFKIIVTKVKTTRDEAVMEFPDEVAAQSYADKVMNGRTSWWDFFGSGAEILCETSVRVVREAPEGEMGDDDT